MVLYTIMPAETVLEGFEEDKREYVEITRGSARLVVEPAGVGKAQVVRLISTDPSDYLDPRFQPGTGIDFQLSDATSM